MVITPVFHTDLETLNKGYMHKKKNFFKICWPLLEAWKYFLK